MRTGVIVSWSKTGSLSFKRSGAFGAQSFRHIVYFMAVALIAAFILLLALSSSKNIKTAAAVTSATPHKSQAVASNVSTVNVNGQSVTLSGPVNYSHQYKTSDSQVNIHVVHQETVGNDVSNVSSSSVSVKTN